VAAPRITLQLLLGALAVGALLLFPSFFYLFRVFKGQTAFAPLAGDYDSVQSGEMKLKKE
jgi:cytochrome d ubiquinol oxidase subunit II